MNETNGLIPRGEPYLIYDITQKGKRVMKWRQDFIDPVTKTYADKNIFYDPPLSQLGLTVSELRPKYQNVLSAGITTVIWVEGEKAADAMNQAIPKDFNALALGLHGQVIPDVEILETLNTAETHVLFGDNDEAGRKAMENLQRALTALFPQAEFASVEHPPEGEPKWDADDYKWKSLDLVQEALGRKTKHEKAEAIQFEAPLYKKKKPLPVEDEFYHGLIGEAVNRLDDHTEATREAMFMTLLTGICPILGVKPHIPQPLRATPNLFTCIVGPQNSGRKGTSWEVIEENFLKKIARNLNMNEDWANSRSTSVDSGQGIINLVAHGDTDRLFVIQEFKALFDAMTRDSSNVDSVMRQAYDRESLQVNRAREVQRVDQANISFLTHITPDELNEQLRAIWGSNGFFRRWGWVYSESTKEVNHLIPPNITEDLVDRFQLSIEYAQRHEAVTLTDESWAFWKEWRRSIQSDDESFISKASAGHETRVARIALVLALLDEAQQADLPDLHVTVGETLREGPRPTKFDTRAIVEVEHLKAAIRWDQYSTDTLAYVFRNRRWDYSTQKLADLLEDEGELSRTQINAQVFRGNKLKAEIETMGEKLEGAGAIRRYMRRKEGVTKGRLEEVWVWIGNN